MTAFVGAWEWNVFLNTFPNCEQLILGFTGVHFKDFNYLEALSAALTEARMGPTLKEICIQTDLSLRAAQIYGIFRAARFCRNLQGLYLTANNYHMRELAQLVCSQGQEKLENLKQVQDVAGAVLRSELNML